MDTWHRPSDGMEAIISDKKAGCCIALQLCELQWDSWRRSDGKMVMVGFSEDSIQCSIRQSGRQSLGGLCPFLCSNWYRNTLHNQMQIAVLVSGYKGRATAVEDIRRQASKAKVSWHANTVS